MFSDSPRAPTGTSAVEPGEYTHGPGLGDTTTTKWLPPEPIHPPAEPSGPPGHPLPWQPSMWKDPGPPRTLCRTARGIYTDVSATVHYKMMIAVREVDSSLSFDPSFERGPAPRVPNPNCYPPASASPRTEDLSSRQDDLSAKLRGPPPRVPNPNHYHGQTPR